MRYLTIPALLLTALFCGCGKSGVKGKELTAIIKQISNRSTDIEELKKKQLELKDYLSINGKDLPPKQALAAMTIQMELDIYIVNDEQAKRGETSFAYYENCRKRAEEARNSYTAHIDTYLAVYDR
jgi:hypothetical protein